MVDGNGKKMRLKRFADAGVCIGPAVTVSVSGTEPTVSLHKEDGLHSCNHIKREEGHAGHESVESVHYDPKYGEPFDPHRLLQHAPGASQPREVEQHLVVGGCEYTVVCGTAKGATDAYRLRTDGRGSNRGGNQS